MNPPAGASCSSQLTSEFLFFRDDGRSREATMLPVEELKGIVVDTARKGTLSPIRGILTLGGCPRLLPVGCLLDGGAVSRAGSARHQHGLPAFHPAGRGAGGRLALLAAQRPPRRRESYAARFQLAPVICPFWAQNGYRKLTTWLSACSSAARTAGMNC